MGQSWLLLMNQANFWPCVPRPLVCTTSTTECRVASPSIVPFMHPFNIPDTRNLLSLPPADIKKHSWLTLTHRHDVNRSRRHHTCIRFDIKIYPGASCTVQLAFGWISVTRLSHLWCFRDRFQHTFAPFLHTQFTTKPNCTVHACSWMNFGTKSEAFFVES